MSLIANYGGRQYQSAASQTAYDGLINDGWDDAGAHEFITSNPQYDPTPGAAYTTTNAAGMSSYGGPTQQTAPAAPVQAYSPPPAPVDQWADRRYVGEGVWGPKYEPVGPAPGPGYVWASPGPSTGPGSWGWIQQGGYDSSNYNPATSGMYSPGGQSYVPPASDYQGNVGGQASATFPTQAPTATSSSGGPAGYQLPSMVIGVSDETTGGGFIADPRNGDLLRNEQGQFALPLNDGTGGYRWVDANYQGQTNAPASFTPPQAERTIGVQLGGQPPTAGSVTAGMGGVYPAMDQGAAMANKINAREVYLPGQSPSFISSGQSTSEGGAVMSNDNAPGMDGSYQPPASEQTPEFDPNAAAQAVQNSINAATNGPVGPLTGGPFNSPQPPGESSTQMPATSVYPNVNALGDALGNAGTALTGGITSPSTGAPVSLPGGPSDQTSIPGTNGGIGGTTAALPPGTTVQPDNATTPVRTPPPDPQSNGSTSPASVTPPPLGPGGYLAQSETEAAKVLEDAATGNYGRAVTEFNTQRPLDTKIYNEGRTDVLPYLTQGKDALTQLGNFAQTNPDFGMTQFNADPGYAFRLKEGMSALENSASARGGLFSGNTMKAITKYGQDMGSQEYQNSYNRYNTDRTAKYNRLNSLAGMGQNAVGQANSTGQNYINNSSNTGQNYVNSAGNYNNQAAAARAAGITGAAQANVSGYQGGVNSLIAGITGAANLYSQGNILNQVLSKLGTK